MIRQYETRRADLLTVRDSMAHELGERAWQDLVAEQLGELTPNS